MLPPFGCILLKPPHRFYTASPSLESHRRKVNYFPPRAQPQTKTHYGLCRSRFRYVDIDRDASARCQLDAVELQLQRAIEIDPKRLQFRFTHRVCHSETHKTPTTY